MGHPLVNRFFHVPELLETSPSECPGDIVRRKREALQEYGYRFSLQGRRDRLRLAEATEVPRGFFREPSPMGRLSRATVALRLSPEEASWRQEEAKRRQQEGAKLFEELRARRAAQASAPEEEEIGMGGEEGEELITVVSRSAQDPDRALRSLRPEPALEEPGAGSEEGVEVVTAVSTAPPPPAAKAKAAPDISKLRASAGPTALLFPGQGSQSVGMLASVKDLPAVQDMLLKANHILGYDLLQLCLKGSEEELEQTRYCQPALFVAGLAGVEKLRAENEAAVESAVAVAGLSLGEYTALCVAGVLSFEEGLRLVKLRGEAMQAAASVSQQAMVSVLGMELEKIEQCCKQAMRTGGTCELSTCLFPKGFVVAGNKECTDSFSTMVLKRGAIRAKEISTSGAFHTSLMQPAQDQLNAALDAALPAMQPPKIAVWMNASAQPMRPGCDPRGIVENLKKQLTQAVQWEKSIQGIIKEGIQECYEVGPQKQLKAVMKRIDEKVWKVTQNVEV